MDEENDQQILDGIDEDIFKVDYELGSFESLNYILDKVESELNLDYILQEKKRLEKQLNVVSRRLSASIMEKEGAYGKEMKRVMDIQNKLSEAIEICRSARKGADKGRKNFTCASLGIVASYRRREGLRDVLKSLSTIKTLQQTNVRLKEMVEEDGDFCGAIQLCIECQKVVNTLKHYRCVSELSSKLTEMLEMIEEHIDASLSKMCQSFNIDTYKGLQKAYSLLGKTQTSMDSLCMHFATAISDKAFSVVHGYVELCSIEVKKIENFRKKEYKELCKYVTNECFIPCLIDLSKSLFNILLNYKRILYFHQQSDTDNSNYINNNDDHSPHHHQSELNSKCQTLDTGHGGGDEGEERSVAAATITSNSINHSDKGDNSDIEEDDEGGGGGGESDTVNNYENDEVPVEQEEEEDQVETDFNRRFIIQKLEHGLGRIWQEAQQKLRLLVQSHDMSSCSFEELMTILRISRRMMDIGSEFCDNNSSEFEETLHAKTVNYFNHYHKTRLDELRMYLENESWTVCPVKNGFQYFDLQEFKFLKPLRTYSLGNLSLAASDTSGPPGQGSSDKSHFFRDSLLRDSSGGIENPFDNICLENEDASDSIIRELERTTNKGIGGGDDTSEDEIEDEMAIDPGSTNCNDNNKGAANCYNEGPLVTNTSLYVLRLIGKYMQIMFLLRQIAFDILLSIFHLFDYYFYTVYTFFSKEISEVRNNCLSLRFKSCLERIESSMKTDMTNENNDLDQHPSTIQSMGLMDRNLSPENLHGLAERIVGIESVMFLASQLNSLQQFFRDLIPSAKHPILDKYYSQAVSVAQDLRYPGYMLVAIRSISYESILLTVENVRWDLTEIPSMHNGYVDCLLREIQTFSSRLETICCSLEAKIPQEAKDMLWSAVLKLANRTFVEGFSMAKKCTPAGRALMQLDYQEFLTKAEKMTAIKPIPERELVEEYIKAYYLMDDALEQWIMSRNEYTQRQLLSLVNCIASEKRVKNRLLAIIDNKFETSNCSNATTNDVRH